MMPRSERARENLVLGVVLIVAGFLFLLNGFGIRLLPQVWRFWPLVLVYLGVSKLIRYHGGPGRAR